MNDAERNLAWSVRPANFTRRTVDLPAKFRREGRWYLVPIYHLLQLSDFGREGIAHSGSYRFADHLYRGEPSGRGWIGRFIDLILLHLAAARGMRARCTQAATEMHVALDAMEESRPLRILTIPCGIPRDVHRLAKIVGSARIEYTGMDIDPAALTAAGEFLARGPIQNPRLIQGDALDASTWPSGEFDFISSTGLGEFLGDDELAVFYGNVFQVLAPGGVFFTSATACEPKADWLLRAFEFEANYRTRSEMELLIRQQPWSSITLAHDSTGLQTFARVVKPEKEGGQTDLEESSPVNRPKEESLPSAPAERLCPFATAGVSLPLLGIFFLALGISQTLSRHDFGRGLMLGLLTWFAFALIGLACSIVAIRRRGITWVSAIGVFFGSLPLLYALTRF